MSSQIWGNGCLVIAFLTLQVSNLKVHSLDMCIQFVFCDGCKRAKQTIYSAMITSEGKCSNDAGLDAYLKVETIKKCITTQHKMLIDLDQMNMKDIYLQVLPSFNGTQRNA